jgi:RNA polymerase sigma-70 factor (ECF subfamily)
MSVEGGFQDGDVTLVRRAATGHKSAFERLVERHQAAVYRFSRSLANDAANAEDATQETFLSAWRSASRFRGEASVRTWLFTIARHAVERLLHHRVSEARDLASLEQLARAAGWGTEDDGLIDRLADGNLLERALAHLPPIDHSLLVLRDLEGLGLGEAAEVLGVSETALRTRLHRARLRLVAALRREVGDGG